jgi:hypothetical protein
MAIFLSDEWFDAVRGLTAEAGELNIPKAMKDVVVNLHIETSSETILLCMKGGLMEKGHVEKPDVTMHMPEDYAHGLLVRGDWSVGMKGYVARKIKVSGNMRKLIPLQLYKPSPELDALRKKIEAMTEKN